jgi:hypothetical protein
MRLSIAPFLLVLLTSTEAFVPGWISAEQHRPIAFQPSREVNNHQPAVPSNVILFAKKKVNAKLAALEALEALESQVNPLETPLSLKELQELEKKRKKEEKATADAASAASGKKNAKAAALAALDGLEDELDLPLSKKEQNSLLKKHENSEEKVEKAGEHVVAEEAPPKLSAKEEKMRKMMEMEEMDSARQLATPVDEQPTLSKKELKALQKKEENMAAKEAARVEKKALRAAELEEMIDEDVPVEEEYESDYVQDDGPTLEDKIRKERPPPRVRVMESAQPGFVSLRLEKVGITFRNQEVLKDVTWGVQSGDRIG